MRQLKYNKELYSKIALIKAAYNFTDRAYVHLDADKKYYYHDSGRSVCYRYHSCTLV